ncbi:MAG: HD domain-containing protein [Lachnospiraceae bacterium]|nr:HD domain-containing protein [Lachnospiraceae bacterium]
MTFKEALDFMNRWHGSRLGLSRMREMAERMGHPENTLRYIHVAGTNGKGSTCAMLESVLRAAGYKTGMFTSPYLESILESIRIGGQNISESDFCRAVEEVRTAVCGDMPGLSEMEDKPTEFEILTMAAFAAFAYAGCDIVIMEVGMGGRLDSTNIIPAPDVCAIVNLSLEHTQFLGDTLEKIAFEKAGIIKKGCYVVTYPVDSEAEDVYRTVCRERGAYLCRADLDSVIPEGVTDTGSVRQPTEAAKGRVQGQMFSWHEYRNLFTALPGRHQISNAVMVLEIIGKLSKKGWSIPETAVREGLGTVSWPARFEILCEKPLFILDGSHNPQCIEALEDNLSALLPDKKIVFLMGVLADKEYDKMLKYLLPHAKAFVCVAPDNPRALPAEDLTDIIRMSAGNAQCGQRAGELTGKRSERRDAGGLEVAAFAEKSIADGVKRALLLAGGGPVVACGSLYMMGDVRKEFLKLADKERLDSFFKFILEIDKDKFIGRQTYLSDGVRKENDAEHAWHMAIMAWLLADYANEKIDVAKTMLMVLIHDLVEIDAGDTYAYDEAARESQAERELAAADRIFGLLPEDVGVKMRAIWDEFEAWETPEAKFARALDNFQPLMLNNATDGISWVEHGVKLSQVLGRNGRSKSGSEKLWEYAYNNFICPNVEKGRIIDDVPDEEKPQF